LQHLMSLKGVSQRQLAKDLNLSHTSIYKYLHNKAGASFDVVKKLAKYFNVPVTYFLEEESKEKPQQLSEEELIKEIEELLRRLPPEKKERALKAIKEQLELMAV